MRTTLIVFDAPAFQDNARLVQIAEELAVQAFIAQLVRKALNMPVFPRALGLDIERLDSLSRTLAGAIRAGLETLSIGRERLAPASSCTLEMSGRHLFYSILPDGGWLFLSVQPMDAGDSLEKLLMIGDGKMRARNVRLFVISILEKLGKRQKIKT